VVHRPCPLLSFGTATASIPLPLNNKIVFFSSCAVHEREEMKKITFSGHSIREGWGVGCPVRSYRCYRYSYPDPKGGGRCTLYKVSSHE